MNEIPFLPEFKELLRIGKKTATSRSKKYGAPFEHFTAFDMEFDILSVQRVPLWIVAEKFYKEEGLNNPDEFVNIWLRIHDSYDPRRIVYLHTFERVDGGKSDG